MVKTEWTCPAIDHGVAIFPDQSIRPCCQVSAEYSKPLSFIKDPERFSDLKTTDRPAACKKCWEKEDIGIPSYRQSFLSWPASSPVNKASIKFLDFRHSNQCNLKCRYCSPHFSNQWAKELEYQQTLLKSNIEPYLDDVLTDDLLEIYWCGGEPLIMKDHYEILTRLVNLGLSKNILLRYNTNLTLLDYKNLDIISLWQKFQKVSIGISIDAVGPELNYIRSGSQWEIIEQNIKKLLQIRQGNPYIDFNFAVTVSMLNIWHLPKLFQYALSRDIKVNLVILTGPDYLSLDAIPTKLQPLAREKVKDIQQYIPESFYKHMNSMLVRDDNEYLFLHAVRHILLLDKIRNENLWEILPYHDLAVDLTLKNYEYE